MGLRLLEEWDSCNGNIEKNVYRRLACLAVSAGLNAKSGAEKCTFKLDITVHDQLSVKVANCTDKFSKDTLDKVGAQKVSMLAGNFKKVTTSAVG